METLQVNDRRKRDVVSIAEKGLEIIIIYYIEVHAKGSRSQLKVTLRLSELEITKILAVTAPNNQKRHSGRCVRGDESLNY